MIRCATKVRHSPSLIEAGNKVKVKRYEGVVHGFVSFADGLDKGKEGRPPGRRRAASRVRALAVCSTSQSFGGAISPAMNCG